MKLSNGWKWKLCALAMILPVAPGVMAQCGLLPAKAAVKPMALHLSAGAAQLRAGGEGLGGEGLFGGPSTMVGMWHVVFTADTSLGAPISPMVVDNALAVWHSDGTEIMNSVRPPQDGNFCMGVWQQTDRNQYYLNHFAWFANAFPNNTNNGIGDPTGPTQIREWVTLSPDGNRFTGNFRLDAYDTSNNVSASFTGTLSGTRITTSTTEGSLVGK